MAYIIHIGVSKNRGVSPQIMNFNRVFHCEPSILGYLYVWKHQIYASDEEAIIGSSTNVTSQYTEMSHNVTLCVEH